MRRGKQLDKLHVDALHANNAYREQTYAEHLYWSHAGQNESMLRRFPHTMRQER